MAFNKKEAEELLAETGRCCCICGKLHKLHLHHMVPKEKGGTDEIDNAIPLCPNCHDEVHGRSTPGHLTRGYTADELRLHKQRTVDLAKIGGAVKAQEALRGVLPDEQIEETLKGLREKQASLEAQLSGPGAVAQDHSVAAGAGGMAAGRDIRDTTVVNVTVEAGRYTGAPTDDPATALAIYRRVVMSACRHLPMRGIDVGASDPGSARQHLDLAQVYVGLDTTSQVKTTPDERKAPGKRRGAEEHETRPLRALEATTDSRHLVILGDPGSGKSTFLNHLCLCLAAHAAEPGEDWLSRLPDWPREEAEAIPIPVVLRDFARGLPDHAPNDQACRLWEFIVARLEAQNLEFAVEALRQALEQGECILLLDGLDEIPAQAQVAAVRHAVAAFAERYPDNRLVVTCRTLSYQSDDWRLEGFPDFEIAALDEEKIEHFITAWYEELARLDAIKPGEAKGLAGRLSGAVRRPDLWRLAPNPLLLTVMALVHTHKGRLPEARALLYEETVDILLWRWEQLKLGGEDQAPVLSELLTATQRTDVDLKRVLWRLAFEAHRQGGSAEEEALADVAELDLVNALAELHPNRSRDWATEVVEAMKLRAGLLLERARGVYTFPHRTFQEYLAGTHLSSQADFAKQATQLVEEAPFWREAILLAVGRLVYLAGDTDKPLALVGELCPEQSPTKDVGWRNAWLAGDALLEMGPSRMEDSALGRDLARRTRLRLVELLKTSRLSPVERAEAGNTVARLGDPRFRADRWSLPDEPLLGFIEIPAGPFRMGTDKEKDGDAYGEETPQHEIDLPTYYLARYPVTVAQFAAFVGSSGYQPGDPDCLAGQLNHPIVRVSWHDAMAYCDWLTERLRDLAKQRAGGDACGSMAVEEAGAGEKGEVQQREERFWQLLCDGRLRVTLPSEAEWEKAARGADARIYPWGREPDPGQANYGDTGIGSTSAVGCFPAGTSPYGCEDLAGNVWEWTRSLWGNGWKTPDFTYPYDPTDGREKLDASDGTRRVLRGGAFWDGHRSVRCSSRGRSSPLGYRSNVIGFRSSLSPFLSDL